ncbi:MAG: putative bifunctional diguanylate cyclase/phosphodiesterase [Myxococcota bacterium]
MRRKFVVSLRAQLWLLFLAVAVPLGGMGLEEVAERRRRATDDVRAEVRALAVSLGLGQEALLEGGKQLVEVLALVPEVTSTDRAPCDALLARLLVRWPQFANLGVIEPDGSVRCSALPVPAGTNLSDRVYFRRVLETKAFAIGRYQVGRITGVPSLNVASPVLLPDGELEAVVFGALDLRWLNALLSRAELPRESHVLVADPDATVLASFPHAPAGVGAPLAAWLEGVADDGGVGHAIVRGPDGERRLVARAGVDVPGGDDRLWLIVTVPTRVAFAEVQRGLVRDAIPVAILLALLAGGLVAADRYLFRRLEQVVGTARRLGAGDLAARTDLPHGRDPVGGLARAFDEMADSVQTQAATLRHQATHDGLTGLANHACLREHLSAAIAHARETGGKVGVVALALDRLEDVEGALGHPTADELLRRLAPRLRDSAPADALVARIGGDQIAVLVPGGEDRAREVARALVDAAHRAVPVGGLLLESGVAAGVAVYPTHGEDADLLLQHADVATTIARRAGTDVATYDPAADPYSPRKLSLACAMRTAIDADELFVLYQPKAALPSGRPIGAEALVRWRSPSFGLVSPMEFVTLAESAGLIRPLTERVLRAAFAQARAWAEAGTPLCVSVNVSARSVTDPAFFDLVTGIQRETGAPVRLLELEITETVLLADPKAARAALGRLHGAGFRVAIDDFGTGYSSLSYLRDLPVDVLKIDKSFVSCADRPLRDPALTRLVVDIAHTLGLEAIAEGVDRVETLRALADMGCDAVQGDVLAPASPPEVVAAWARRALQPA